MTYQSSIKNSDVLELEIADGLKELLMASILGIEDYIAKIVCNATKQKSK